MFSEGPWEEERITFFIGFLHPRLSLDSGMCWYYILLILLHSQPQQIMRVTRATIVGNSKMNARTLYAHLLYCCCHSSIQWRSKPGEILTGNVRAGSEYFLCFHKIFRIIILIYRSFFSNKISLVPLWV